MTGCPLSFETNLHSSLRLLTGLICGLLAGTTHAQTPAAAPVAPTFTATPAPAAPVRAPLNPALPTLFVIGDSTASNGARGGWGDPLSDYFDSAKINVANRARGSRSSRSFQLEGHWANALQEMKAGDYVLIQMGQNDGRPLQNMPARSSLPGTGEETQEVTLPNGTKDIVHTFGWYLRKYIVDTRAKGATPLLLSLTAKNLWSETGQNRRPYDNYPKWTQEVAQSEKVPFLDHINIMGEQFDRMGQEKAAPFFRDSTHTTEAGAGLNAAGVVAGLKQLDGPLVKFLSAKGQAVPPYVPAK